MQEKKIVIASDHAGYSLKEDLVSYLTGLGYDVMNLGNEGENQSVDYPDMAEKLANGMRDEGVRGVLICGSGIGMSMAINRYPYLRGALVHTPELAKLTRQHNDANVLVLGARFIELENAHKIVDTFLSTPFDGGRHLNRVQKLGGLHG